MSTLLWENNFNKNFWEQTQKQVIEFTSFLDFPLSSHVGKNICHKYFLQFLPNYVLNQTKNKLSFACHSSQNCHINISKLILFSFHLHIKMASIWNEKHSLYFIFKDLYNLIAFYFSSIFSTNHLLITTCYVTLEHNLYLLSWLSISRLAPFSLSSLSLKYSPLLHLLILAACSSVDLLSFLQQEVFSLANCTWDYTLVQNCRWFFTESSGDIWQ